MHWKYTLNFQKNTSLDLSVSIVQFKSLLGELNNIFRHGFVEIPQWSIEIVRFFYNNNKKTHRGEMSTLHQIEHRLDDWKSKKEQIFMLTIRENQPNVPLRKDAIQVLFNIISFDLKFIIYQYIYNFMYYKSVIFLYYSLFCWFSIRKK